MISRLRARLGGERGQALIFGAVVMSAILLTMALAVEGGRVLVQYRKMQAAADMSALVGAQGLPCGSGLSGCSTATSLACTYAGNNGYSDCTGHTSLTDTCTNQVCVWVPPISCSPYDALDYGNGKYPSNNCSGGTLATQFSYIETQIKQPVTIPVFNVSFNLYAHAVARYGKGSPRDFALAVLDHTSSGALTIQGAAGGGLLIVGPVQSNSTSASSITSSGPPPGPLTCGGEWYTSSNEAASSTNVRSQTADSATPNFSPPTCNPSGQDATPAWFANQPFLNDIYCTTLSPPAGAAGTSASSSNGPSETCSSSTGAATSMANCAACNDWGYYYTWNPGSTRNSGAWAQAPNNSKVQITGSSQAVEFFPGKYDGIKVTGSHAQVYLNPGVYTMSGDFDLEGGTICIYGAPVCDRTMSTSPNIPGTTLNCGNAPFSGSGSTVNADVWYYYCSPWGIWDDSANLGTDPRPSSYKTPPSFYIPGTGNSTVPLNGVTIVATNGAIIKINGGSAQSLAAPNPCPGKSTASDGHAPFPAGVSTTSKQELPAYKYGYGDATYPPTNTPGASYSLAGGEDLRSTSQSTSVIGNTSTYQQTWVHPNADFTLTGECDRSSPSTYAGDVWQGERPTDQVHGSHLHFLFFDRGTSSNPPSVTLNGGSTQAYYGTLYAIGPDGAGLTTITGSSGSAGGPPMLFGQIIVNDVKFSGSASIEIFYRPCDPATATCSSGNGTGLIQ